MIKKEEIHKILEDYDDITIGVLCSHSALQIIHGAKLEGFKTIGICTKERKRAYSAFSRAKPDEFIVLDKFSDIIKENYQEKLIEENTIIIPHGSLVEYVGPNNLLENFYVPIYGNRDSLKWEGSRDKQMEWLEKAGIKTPKKYESPSNIDNTVFVKFDGAKGGEGFFIAESEKDYEQKLKQRLEKGTVTEKDIKNVTIQEFIPGIRYYPHYFYSLYDQRGAELNKGAIEILGMDRRIEPIDESYRGLPDIPTEFFDYTVTGNEPLVIREKLLVDLVEMGENVIKSSKKLFNPGIFGPFCLETVYHPERGFTVFEISGRIVAGTNLYPKGSPYSSYLFEEPMSTGRRIAREIKQGFEKNELSKVIY